ncbi:MAG: class I SAM-dependent methyltransferase [Bosea sp.]|jgi:cyclopropane-fatty-acyl-phospholipid synthase|nr:class I SAM-dependent methyltransferase [Bosea sp. (in: a-proteobacteria)]
MSEVSSRPHAPAAAAQRVTAQNLDAVAGSLPSIIRSAFRYGTRIERGSLTVILPGGARYLFQGQQRGCDAVFQINDFAFARRLATGGDIGFAEAYLRGEWETPNLAHFLELFATNYTAIQTMLDGKPLARLWQIIRHFLNRNTRAGSRKNIYAHYDLGNSFYSSWLDQSMTYSSGIYAPGDNDLSSAQARKYRELACETGIGPSDHVLEIGCGWGGFAEFAAREIGCRVTGLTISRAQHDFAVARIAAAGLSDKVTIKLQDYRDETGTYDRIASIEMFEAVGEQFWPIYFQQVRDRLRDGGTAGLQVITIRDESFQYYKREMDFIRAYIFPGGMLPTLSHMRDLGQRFNVPMVNQRAFGLDYAQTLSDWRDRFRAAWPNLMPLGFDERFRRMWEYYLAYCEAGFRSGNIDVRQMVFRRG